MIRKSDIAGVILAGGKATRMGFRDKALLDLNKRPLIEYVIENAREQVNTLLISVNRNQHLYEYLNHPLIEDKEYRYAGPLAGIHQALRYLSEQHPEYKYMACFPADVPLFPEKLIEVLANVLNNSGSYFACCRHQEQIQPLFSLWRVDTLAAVKKALDDGVFGPKLMLSLIDSVVVDIADNEPGLFFNINTRAALSEAEALLA